MFWAIKKSPIIEEIGKFHNLRKKYSTSTEHVKYLHQFVRVTGVTSSEEITEQDVHAYLKSLRHVSSSDYRKMTALCAINLFMTYTKSEGKKSIPMRGRGRPQKERRNNNIFNLREKDGMSFDQIAKKYKLNKRTVYDIYKRLENKG